MRKYLRREDFSPAIPIEKEKLSILDLYKGIIESYLDEDAKSWRKQRHSARRIHERLVEEYGVLVVSASYEVRGSYPYHQHRALRTSSGTWGCEEGCSHN